MEEKVEIPNFHGELLPFQVEDVAKLIRVPSALNCNEMGCGKTIEAIAMDVIYRNHSPGPTLVIAPLAAVDDAWERWLYELTDYNFTTIDTKNRERSWDKFTSGNGDVFVTHWQSLLKMPELASYNWMHVIADEVQYVQNRKKTADIKVWDEQQGKNVKVGEQDTTTGCFKRIQAPRKLAMSGTPLEKLPDRLWSILNWLYPLKYKAYWKFYNEYVEYVIDHFGYRKELGVRSDKLPKLHAEMAKFFVRHLKQEVNKQMPEKYYSILTPPLTTPQQKIYKSLERDMLAWLGDDEADLLTADLPIVQSTRLHQVANATIELDENGNVILIEPSNKIDCLVENVLNVTQSPVIVFTSRTGFLDLVEKRMRKEQISFVRLDGSTSRMARQGAIDRFQRGQARVFLGTIGAAGTAITLTAASTVVFLDEDDRHTWNDQAEDRAWRFGQTEPVHIIHILSKKTVDQKRERRLKRKAEWFRETLGDSS